MKFEEAVTLINTRKNTKADLQKIDQVIQAIKEGVLSTEVTDYKKFTKAHCLRLYEKLVVINREDNIKKLVETTPKNYYTITNRRMFNGLISLLNSTNEYALDTETNGLDVDSYIVGLSISLPKHPFNTHIKDLHFYIPVRHNTNLPQLEADFVFKELKPYFENDSLKILHNGKFDYKMLLKEDIVLNNIFDTMIGFKVLNENEHSYALKNIATKYKKQLDIEDDSCTFEELFGKTVFSEVGLDVATVYACKDTHITYKLYNKIINTAVKDEKILKAINFEMELLNKVVLRMENNGIYVNTDSALNLQKELDVKIQRLTEEIQQETGVNNPNSTQQLLKYFIEKGIVKSKCKSVNAEVLKELAPKHKTPKDILELREMVKYKGYLNLNPHSDNRIRCNFNQLGAKTTRFSSNNMNLQNQPDFIRPIFEAEEGNILLSMDYSGQEPRVMAHLSKDKALQDNFKTDVDFYSKVASKLFNVPVEECGDKSKYRKDTKIIVLAVMYGMGAFTLSKSLGCKELQAEDFINKFMNEYPNMELFIKETKEEVLNKGYVYINDMYKRRFPEAVALGKKCKKLTDIYGESILNNLWTSNLTYDNKRIIQDTMLRDYNRILRQAVNCKIQGFSAYMTKQAMINIQDYIDLHLSKDFNIIATLHDEVLLEIPEDTSKETIVKLAGIMATAVKLEVPVKVDIDTMKIWSKPIDHFTITR
jgi:DNA polymerase-1